MALHMHLDWCVARADQGVTGAVTTVRSLRSDNARNGTTAANHEMLDSVA
jgi:hypothetical protein